MIPTFNERRNLAELVAQLTALLDPELGDDYELIVVDDDSPDRTWELAAELAGKYSKLRVLRREDERGLSTAVIRGCAPAKSTARGNTRFSPRSSARTWSLRAT